jgi:hypothetical protein
MPSNTIIQLIENRSEGFSDDRVRSVILKTAGSGPFGDGCMIVAQALQQIYGGRIWVLIGRWSQQAEHAVLKVGDMFYDAAGPGALERISWRFSEAEGVKIQSARPIAPGDLPEASRSCLAATEVAQLLRR